MMAMGIRPMKKIHYKSIIMRARLWQWCPLRFEQKITLWLEKHNHNIITTQTKIDNTTINKKNNTLNNMATSLKINIMDKKNKIMKHSSISYLSI